MNIGFAPIGPALLRKEYHALLALHNKNKPFHNKNQLGLYAQAELCVYIETIKEWDDT